VCSIIYRNDIDDLHFSFICMVKIKTRGRYTLCQ